MNTTKRAHRQALVHKLAELHSAALVDPDFPPAPEVRSRNLRAALLQKSRGGDAFISSREARRRIARALRKAEGVR
jgi:hypothetical protein